MVMETAEDGEGDNLLFPILLILCTFGRIILQGPVRPDPVILIEMRTKTYRARKVTGGTVKKSTATIESSCFSRMSSTSDHGN